VNRGKPGIGTDSAEHRFISCSDYTIPADIKKLRFIYSAMAEYSALRKKSFEQMQVLEIGCGSGSISFPVASLGCKVKAIDVNPAVVEDVAKRVHSEGIENLSVSVEDGRSLDDGQLYDIIIVSEVFEHVPEPFPLASSVATRLAPGGRLIATIPNGYGPWEVKNRLDPKLYARRCGWVRRLFGKPEYGWSGAGHWYYFTRSGFVGMLSELSLREIAFGRSDSILAAFGWLSRKSAISHQVNDFDCRMADVLPYWLASGWYFVFERPTAG
jgi:SAM-dependent methyltransferase